MKTTMLVPLLAMAALAVSPLVFDTTDDPTRGEAAPGYEEPRIVSTGADLETLVPVLAVIPTAVADNSAPPWVPASPASDGAASPKSPGPAPAKQAASFTKPPAEQCFDMAKAVVCPWLGSIPMVRDIAGQFAFWAGVSCPVRAPF